jgi:hypothetical protein
MQTPKGDLHGKQVREEGEREGRACDAREEARQAALRPLRQEGHQPEAGHRDRSVRSARGWWESAAKEIVFEEVVIEEAIELEEIFFEEALFEEALTLLVQYAVDE